jgi:hypothetical protein
MLFSRSRNEQVACAAGSAAGAPRPIEVLVSDAVGRANEN